MLFNALEQNNDALVILKLISRLFVHGCDLSKTSCIFREHDPQLKKTKERKGHLFWKNHGQDIAAVHKLNFLFSNNSSLCNG